MKKGFFEHWYVYLFPAFAALLTGGLVYQHYYHHGKLITITLDEASAISPEKTHIRFRGVDIGVVKDMTISENHKEVVVHALLNLGTDEFAVKGSRFWVVTPKVTLQGLSGLDTIFAGPYIEGIPGPSDGPEQTDFRSKQELDAKEAVENTTPFFIEADSAESISVGDAITFRGINVGNTTKITLDKSAQHIEIQINIQNRYLKLIRTNTAFWRKVGIQANLGLFNSEIKVNSLDSILHGGLEFFTPDNAGPVAKADTKFSLNASRPKGSEKWNPKLD